MHFNSQGNIWWDEPILENMSLELHKNGFGLYKCVLLWLYTFSLNAFL